jgi:hypothetical protein
VKTKIFICCVLIALCAIIVPVASAANNTVISVKNNSAQPVVYQAVWIGYPDNYPGEAYLLGADPIVVATATVGPGESYTFILPEGKYRIIPNTK